MYKTKLQLCAAQLLNCDFLMCIEPTELIAATLFVAGAMSGSTVMSVVSLFAFCPLRSCVCLALCGSVSTPACGARCFRLCDRFVDSWCARALDQGEIASA